MIPVVDRSAHQLRALYEVKRPGGGDDGEGKVMISHTTVMKPLTSYPNKAGTEYTGLSLYQVRYTSRASHVMFGEWHEW